ncbi:MAG: tRNA uridine-5-carboxymethylaminomethyl(34) synthesis GTPase MnmE [Christensenellaceae bacterium]|jgi:tRNA modification GTPase|nr:tRNA uridine-5-carboxymethylaminomethyl(34) synthesis GTPase MnmE [Christensenellaceae bacterium]
MQTIVACATPLSTAGAIGIIRLSGDDAIDIAQRVFILDNPTKTITVPRHMYLGTVCTKYFKDRAFFVFFKSPKSFTGEDIVEIQFHGGISTAKGILRALVEAGARPAVAGEFTKRAFLNGKLTLNEAEGIADIINAQSSAAAMQAYRMLSGEFSKEINSCSEVLLQALATLDCELDYPEEMSDVEHADVEKTLRDAEIRLNALASGSQNRKLLTDGITVALIGLPNVGKSSLLNAIVKDDRAIVSSIPGTTRDVLREHLEIDGFSVTFIDTAGIHESQDNIEKMGVDRAKKAMLDSDIILFIIDLSQKERTEEQKIMAEISDKKHIIVGNKGDIAKYQRRSDIVIEAKNCSNIDKLIELIKERLDLDSTQTGSVFMRERHEFAIKNALMSTQSALAACAVTTADCISVDVRSAYLSLAEITGDTASEAVIDKIFASFCVGK